MNHLWEKWPVYTREKRNAPRVKTVSKSCRRCGRSSHRAQARKCGGKTT